MKVSLRILPDSERAVSVTHHFGIDQVAQLRCRWIGIVEIYQSRATG
jgi:hypothetical protein